MCVGAGQLFARAYLKRLAERLTAQPGAQVTDMPVQRIDRQYYGNGNGAVVDMQLQVGCYATHAYTLLVSRACPESQQGCKLAEVMQCSLWLW